MPKRLQLVSNTLQVGGRPATAFRIACQQVIVDAKGLEFARQVLRGDKIDVFVTPEGQEVRIPASVRDRMMVLKFLSERAYGMPKQEIEVAPRDPSVDLTGEEVRLRLLGMIPVLVNTLPASTAERASLLAGINAAEVVLGD